MMRGPIRLLGVAAIAVTAVAVAVVPSATPTAEAAARAATYCDDRLAGGPAPEPELVSYEAVKPFRVVDTRDGTGGVSQPLGAGCTLQLELPSTVVPASAQAVGLSLTALADIRGFFTVFPCSSGRPITSNLNSRPGMATPNFVAALLDPSRSVCIYSQRAANVVVDVAGWWSDGPNRFRSIAPERAYDSRLELPIRLPAGAVQNVPIGGVVVPADATAAVINLTGTDPDRRGWLVAYPCGTTPPVASNLNVRAGENRAVAAIVGLGRSGAAAGQLCVTSNIDTHFVIDVTGYYAPAPAFGPAPSLRPVAGERVLDTRDGTGGFSTPFAGGVIRSLDPVQSLPFADRATSVLVNVVATNGAGLGNVRVFACRPDGSAPVSSSLNFGAVLSATNLVQVDLDASRRICIVTTTQADIVVDLFGVMVAPPGSLAERLSFGSLAQFPRYAPAGVDYAINCAAGVNQLKFDLELLPFATATVRGMSVGSGVTTVPATADDLIPVVVRRGGQTTSFLFRCLPANFPRLSVDRPGQPTPGWYLTGFGQGANPEPGFFNVIFDDRGAPIWYKQSSEVLINLQRRPDGALLGSTQGQFFGTPDDDLEHWIRNLDGTRVSGTAEWGTHDVANLPVDHHDVVQLDGGGWVNVSYPLRTGVDTTAMPGGGFGDDWVLDSAIVEYDAAGAPGWTWNTNDLAANGQPHFSPAEVTFPQRFGRYTSDRGGEVDMIHVNSVQRLDGGADEGDYIVSARHLDAVFRVDSATKEVEWILGSLPSDPAAPGYVENSGEAPRLTIVDDPWGGPRRQHDARLEGNLLTIYDNRTGMAGQTARVVVYEIDAGAGTATLVRELRNPSGLLSGALGSARVAADGSVLVNWGQLQPMFQEFDAAGRLMLSIGRIPFGSSYRIVKYPIGDFDIAELRATAGGFFEDPPP